MSSEELNCSLSEESLKYRTGDTDWSPQAMMARGFGGVLIECGQTPLGGRSWENPSGS